jgi:hypothetical protein
MDVAAKDQRRQRHREGVDKPALQKAEESSGSGLHILAIKISTPKCASTPAKTRNVFGGLDLVHRIIHPATNPEHLIHQPGVAKLRRTTPGIRLADLRRYRRML